MPGLSGLEFARKVKEHNSNIQIIMLTGEMHSKSAIDAFNEGIIDRYVNKGTDIYPKINNYIDELQKKYFATLTKNLFYSLVEKSAAYLKTPEFQDILTKMIKQNDIVEYYLLDKLGSFLLFDKNKKCFCFVVRPEKEMQAYTNIAKDNNATPSIIEALASRKKLLALFTDEDYAKPVDAWEENLVDTHFFHAAGEKVYYSLIEFFSMPNNRRNAD
ncbi:MAG: response regulator [Gammaproteobacteria bacterium]|jgi:response regulator RpfG family c-di-GMP phosphodiesterase|nr:response regulator [Gammaproteobacteria bacterium]